MLSSLHGTLQEAVDHLTQGLQQMKTPIAVQRQLACIFTDVVYSIWTKRNKRGFDDSYTPKHAMQLCDKISSHVV